MYVALQYIFFKVSAACLFATAQKWSLWQAVEKQERACAESTNIQFLPDDSQKKTYYSLERDY